MENYQERIEQHLSKYMPKFNEVLNEAEDQEQYVKEAPKVKGYFRLISLRYMKRVKDIKKLCVEYINTYIEGALNVAKKMDDDIKLMDAQNSLAKSIHFEKEGFNTSGAYEASSKSGVLFLVGEKSLSDKLDAILKKIGKLASRSKILQDWTDLMVLQSKIVANDIIFEKTNEMLKDEKNKKQQEKKREEDHKQQEKEMEKTQSEHEKIQKQLTKEAETFGEMNDWFGDLLTQYEINREDYIATKPDIDSDLLLGLFDEDKNEINKSGSFNQIRTSFYEKFGFEQDMNNIVKQLYNEKQKDQYKDLTTIEWQYMFASAALVHTKPNQKFVASPVDVSLVIANIDDKQIQKHIENNKKNYIYDTKFDLFKINTKSEGFDKLFNEIVKQDKNFDKKALYVYEQLFEKVSDESGKTQVNDSLHIMTPAEFIFEQMFNSYIETRDMELAMMDILDDIEDGCLYIGNFPQMQDAGVDYVMLDGDGGFGFYKELGNLDMALATGEPQNVNLVKLTDGQRQAILSNVLDYLSKDLFSKLG